MNYLDPTPDVSHIRPRHILKLREWANQAASLFGGEVYLVGSRLRDWTAENPPVDWDIRLLLADTRFLLRYYPDNHPMARTEEENAKTIQRWQIQRATGLFSPPYWAWADEMVKQSDRARNFTTLNIDFQVYPASYWETFDGPRFRLDTRGYDFSGGELLPVTDKKGKEEEWL